jgi:hypothetical protein
MSGIRVRGNEAREGRNKTPPQNMIQYEPLKQDKDKIEEIKKLFIMSNHIHHLMNYRQQVK